MYISFKSIDDLKVFHQKRDSASWDTILPMEKEKESSLFLWERLATVLTFKSLSHIAESSDNINTLALYF